MIEKSWTLALDIVARPGSLPVLIAVDKATGDYTLYQLGGDWLADAVSPIIAALEREIDACGECPTVIEADHSITFCHPDLHAWAAAKGIAWTARSPSPIVEALIRQHAMDWA
jgi:hypothetical protein